MSTPPEAKADIGAAVAIGRALAALTVGLRLAIVQRVLPVVVR